MNCHLPPHRLPPSVTLSGVGHFSQFNSTFRTWHLSPRRNLITPRSPELAFLHSIFLTLIRSENCSLPSSFTLFLSFSFSKNIFLSSSPFHLRVNQPLVRAFPGLLENQRLDMNWRRLCRRPRRRGLSLAAAAGARGVAYRYTGPPSMLFPGLFMYSLVRVVRCFIKVCTSSQI